jgi:hypothetical protein
VLACAAVPTLRTLALAAALASFGCIERPPRDGQAVAVPRPQVDRSRLSDVLVPGVPPDLTPVGAVFGNAIELVGYRLEPAQLVPNHFARVTFYWRARGELAEPWHVFVHLDETNGSGGRINRDHDPAGGRYPTDAWRAGDLIQDPIVFPVGTSPLYLFVGFFSQGEMRLPLTNVGRGRDDGSSRLLAGVLPLAK